MKQRMKAKEAPLYNKTLQPLSRDIPLQETMCKAPKEAMLRESYSPEDLEVIKKELSKFNSIQLSQTQRA